MRYGVQGEISQQATDLKDELVALRRDFHRYPELGFKEFRTQKKIHAYLEKLGLEVSTIAATGIVALLRGEHPGKTILLRADMDAIPVQEGHDHDFRSQHDGIMHACGHDGHMSMLLGAAKVLTACRSSMAGNVKFAFQPNEEDAGAYRMIEDGVMDNPKVDASVGMHLWSQAASGTMDIDSGPIMAASHYFTLTIQGKGGHAGFTHEAIDPILVSTTIVQAVQAIQSREVNALCPAVIVFTEIHAGTSTTIVPENVEMKGSIRFLYEGGEELRERFERIVKHTCAAHRVSYSLQFQIGNHLLCNNPEMVGIAREVALDILVDPDALTSKVQTMAGEDYSDYTLAAPGVFIFLGIYNQAKGIIHPHHHPLFDIDEDVLPLGVEMYVRMALKYLKKAQAQRPEPLARVPGFSSAAGCRSESGDTLRIP